MTTVEALAVGLQCHRTGDLAGAESLYLQILQVDARHAEAMHYLGVVAHQQGRHEAAIDCMRQSVRLNPGNASFWCNLGLVWMALGKTQDAIECYCNALRSQPNYAEAFNNLGIAFEQIENWSEAIDSWRQALTLKPAFAEAWYNLGNVRRRQGQLDEAIDAYRQACRHRQPYPKALNNLGTAFDLQNNHDEAVRCYEQAVRANPGFAEAWCNWGKTLQRQDKLDEAAQCFRQALAVNANHAEAHVGLGLVLFYQGQPDAAVHCFRQALAAAPGLAHAQSMLLFCMNYDPKADPQAIFAEHCSWGRQHLAEGSPPHVHDPDLGRRLRIGYVSPDLRQSALIRYIEPVLANHDPQQFEVFCYAEVPIGDACTQRLQKLAQGWCRTCGMTDAEVAQRIRADKIDILVDLAGHTANSRLRVFAHKPAPVQATWLGYLNTTGLAAVDYRLTDEGLHPGGQPCCDVEELVRLPGGMCCFAPPREDLPVGPLPALKRGSITFGSLNIPFKVNASVIELWSKVLLALPNSRLLMFHDKLTSAAQERIREQFLQHGIDGQRLDLRKGAVSPGYLGVYNEIDIGLDTFPFSGGVTTFEALWMGVPVLALAGRTPAGRNSAAILARVGLADWPVATPADFVARAVFWSQRCEQLACLRRALRERMRVAVCDGERFTRQLEDNYRALWRPWRERQGPAHK